MEIPLDRSAHSEPGSPCSAKAVSYDPLAERQIADCARAGFLYARVGAIRTMPGLATRPGFIDIDLDEHGEIVGLF